MDWICVQAKASNTPPRIPRMIIFAALRSRELKKSVSSLTRKRRAKNDHAQQFVAGPRIIQMNLKADGEEFALRFDDDLTYGGREGGWGVGALCKE